MISRFDLENTIPDWALCFRWDIVLRGREATPLDEHADFVHQGAIGAFCQMFTTLIADG